LARQEGIHLPATETAQRHLQVRLAMHPPGETLSPQMTIAAAVEWSKGARSSTWPVTDDRGVWGVVSLAQLEQVLADGGDKKKVSEVVEMRDFPHMHADQSLDLALERMGATGFDLLPVVSRARIHDLEGVVTLIDVLRAFGVRGERTNPTGGDRA